MSIVVVWKVGLSRSTQYVLLNTQTFELVMGSYSSWNQAGLNSC